MNELELRREKLVEPALHDRMGLAAADFHHLPRPGDRALELVEQLARQRAVAILIQVLHRSSLRPAFPSRILPVCLRRALTIRCHSEEPRALRGAPTPAHVCLPIGHTCPDRRCWAGTVCV